MLLSTEQDEKGLLLQGPTGTGKTTLVAHIGGEINKPVMSQNFTNNIEEIDVIGGPVPIIDEDGNNVLVVKDGPLVIAMKYGLIYVAEEINMAKPGVNVLFNSVLDGNGTIVDGNNEIVRAAPGFKLVGTLNPRYKGARTFNKSLVNRMGAIIIVEQPTPKQLFKMLNTKTSYGETKEELLMFIRLMSVFKNVSDEIRLKQYDAALSIRQLMAATRHLRRGFIFQNAVLYGITHQVSNDDDKVVELITKTAEAVSHLKDEELKVLAQDFLPSNYASKL